MEKIYLDYAATTPVDPAVAKAMAPFLNEKFGNTMSLHSFGQEAKLALEQSRQTLASLINAKPNEIIFTSSATESNNLTLKGIALSERSESRGLKNHIIISQIEHPCIIESAKWLESQGFKITKIPVDKFGMVNSKDVEKAIRPETILVSIIHASNEIGTIQNITKIGKICREKKVLFHTDASQSFGKTLIDVKKMNIDLLTASSHKMYGPKGVGLLFVREGIKLVPLLHGGGQENGLRSSTVNLPAIVGFAKAVELCQKEIKKETGRLSKLRDKLIKEVLKIKGAYLNGHPTQRLPNNANFRFDFIEGESLVMRLDLEGIACSTGSACSSYKLEPSHVLLATGLKPEQAHGSLRVSLGRFTTEKEINKLIKVLPKIVEKIRQISPYGKKD
jgi:cysteine desulfurase